MFLWEKWLLKIFESIHLNPIKRVMEYAKITERLKNKIVIKTVMKRAKVYIKNNKEFQKKKNNKKYLLGML